MADKTGIEWTDATWNPVSGCDKVSPGCDNCYALTQAKRLKAMGSPRYQNDGDPRTSGPGFGVTEHPAALDQPLRWTKPRMIFVNSMSDLFHPKVSTEFIVQVFAVMAVAQQHTFQVLTKRPARMERLTNSDEFVEMVELAAIECADAVKFQEWTTPMPWPLPNVWLGTSIEHNDYCWRAPLVRDSRAAVRFISAEPLLGPLHNLDLSGIDWLIVGAESGHGARFMHANWARQLRDLCAEFGTAFFVKQLWGGTRARKNIATFAEDLRIREYPTAR
jgi:protein gp37